MSLFNLFKHKEKIEGSKSKNYTLENLPVLIEDELKDLDNRSERLKNELKEMTDLLSLEINEKIPKLKMLNLDKRKEELRLKEIVMISLHDYISFLERFIKDLEKVEPRDTKEYIKEIQITFNHFNKSSRMIYERATILIGKELAEVRNRIDNFAKEFNEKLESNRKYFEKKDLIRIIKDNLEELKESDKIQKQIEDSLADFKRKISKIEEDEKLFEEDYEEYKKSKDSIKFIEEQEKIKQENKIINEEVLKLKQEINLKNLAKYFHEDPKKIRIIKDYSENFSNSLKHDDDISIIKLLKEANLNFNEEKIKELKQKLAKQRLFDSDKRLKEFEDKIYKKNQDLKHERDELEHEKIKKQRFEENHKKILKKIENEAQKIWPEIKILD